MFTRALRDLLDRLASAIEEEDTAKSEPIRGSLNLRSSRGPNHQLAGKGGGD